MQQSKQKGFSLIELLIVVAIILIIAAIAIPNMLRARISANESAAVGNLHHVNTAEVLYISAYPSVGFAIALTDMGGNCVGGVVPTSAAACLMEDTQYPSQCYGPSWKTRLCAYLHADRCRIWFYRAERSHYARGVWG